MAQGQNKAMRVSIGILLMTAFVMILFGLITRYAGGWGVPYFSFTSDRGSPCTNKLTGYVCDPITLADVQFYSDAELPADTKVVSGSYVATHDYVLKARMEVPKASAPAAMTALADEFGPCVAGHPVPMETTQLTAVCVLLMTTGPCGIWAALRQRPALVCDSVRTPRPPALTSTSS